MRGVIRAALAAAFVLGLAVPTVALSASGGSAAAAGTRTIASSGTTSIRPSPTGSDAIQDPEIRRRSASDEGAGSFNRPMPGSRRPFPNKPFDAPVVKSSAVVDSNPELDLGFEGLNHRDQRLANGGNQFSLEPPDQALCVGSGFVVEATNSVLRVRNTSGSALTGVQDLNTFFGYPAAIDRSTGVFGPQVIDPVCYFDPDSKRFIVVITTLHSTPSGDFTGKNTIDVAVSNTSDPTGVWTIYSIPAQNDGTDGTPNHGCTLDGSTPGPCFQDYPHVGGDRNGVYISTNEYDLFGPSYSGGQIFALSKNELAAHPSSIKVTLMEDIMVEGVPGFTVWPAISNAGDYDSSRGGTEYFLSTIAGDGSETGNPTGTARRIGVWALTNTSSLDSATPALELTSRLINSQVYVFPPAADQKPGDIPLGECLNDNTLFDPDEGIGCWFLFFDPPVTWQPEVESTPDSLDSRMQQVWYAKGRLWASSGTAVNVDGEVKAGIAWYSVHAKIRDDGQVGGSLVKRGYLALANNNLTMPAITMAPNGKGAIAFTILGEDYFPSAGYVTITDKGAVSPIHVAADGLGPTDGFTSYKAFVGDPPRTRWGDYGAAVTDGNDIWIASEWIAQTCTLDEYLTGAIGSCGGTRTALANWSTRLSKLSP